MLLKNNRIYKSVLTFLAFNLATLLNAQTVPNSQIFADDQAADQDDMCIWIHPDPSKSTVVTSDKSARKLFVYDLDGSTVQIINYSEKPRNIDVRYNFSLSGENVDIVGVGLGDQKIYFYTVDKATRKLIPAGSFDSDMSSLYGFCLYHNMTNNKYYAFASTNSGSGTIKQWELIDNGDGTVGGIHKRTWENGSGGLTEGLVADDETKKFYAGSEDDAIYKYDADPVSENPTGEKIVTVGENGLEADIEGIALYFAADGEGYLIVSSQGNSTFKVYDRKPPHNFVKTFEVNSVSGTDGLDVTNVNMGSLYPKGLLVVHDGKRAYGAKYEDIGLSVDTDYWKRDTTK
ncbi:MAG: phytase [Calditrichaeota bacterium]|nr:MAG: hypothetical protein DWQ03_11855 [Calditrichota bacterium]MBL1207051.1 phytase [Calditrichota bacterium]NOG46880.1 phytase [Calditrichota bacterium]